MGWHLLKFSSIFSILLIVVMLIGIVGGCAAPPAPTPITAPPPPGQGPLAEGVSGRPKGTAGWASNIAIAEARKISPDLKLMHVTCVNPGPGGRKAEALDTEGKLLDGCYWVFEYLTPDRKTCCRVKVYYSGGTEVSPGPTNSVHPITNWELDSDQLLKIARELKPDVKFGFLRLVGSYDYQQRKIGRAHV